MKIVNKLNRYIYNHKKLNYVLKCIRRIGDDTFIYNVLGRNPEVVCFEKWGDKLADKIIYFIEIGTKGDGFFAEYRKLLNYLYYAEMHALTPYVYFNSQFAYIDKKNSDSNTNFFNTFFNSYEGLKYNDVLQGRNVIRCNISHIDVARNIDKQDAYAISDKYISEMALITRKYIEFNDSIKKYVADSLQEIGFEKKILGVHFRGSDYKKGYNGHPKYISPSEYVKNAKEIFIQGNYNKIFLATDDEEALTIFKSEFQEKLIYYQDVVRTEGEISVAFSKVKRDNHHYKLGLEVIRDMLTLSKCESIIAGLSQVSICSMITNRAWEKEYTLIHIMDRGINHNKKDYLV